MSDHLDHPRELFSDRFHGNLTAEDFAALVARSTVIVDRYKPIFGISHWQILVQAQRLDENKAEIETWHEYRQAEITVNPWRLHHADDVELEETLVHELAHAFASPFIDGWKNTKKSGRQKLEESLVSDITGAVLRAIKYGYEQGCSRTLTSATFIATPFPSIPNHS